MRIGIFGGTFNPIHTGHLRVAEEVREALGLERILFVPSSLPPHKELDFGVSGKRRLGLVERAVAGNPAFDVLTFEVEQPGPSYTVRTLEHVRANYKTVPYFILGQDAFNEFASWYDVEGLLESAHFVVMSRPGARRPDLDEILGTRARAFSPTKRGFRSQRGREILLVDVTPLDISSSRIRDLVRAGRSIRYLVPPAVEAYIRDEGLYRS